MAAVNQNAEFVMMQNFIKNTSSKYRPRTSYFRACDGAEFINNK